MNYNLTINGPQLYYSCFHLVISIVAQYEIYFYDSLNEQTTFDPKKKTLCFMIMNYNELFFITLEYYFLK